MKEWVVITKGWMKVWPNLFLLMPAKVRFTCPPTNPHWYTHERDKDRSVNVGVPVCARACLHVNIMSCLRAAIY